MLFFTLLFISHNPVFGAEFVVPGADGAMVESFPANEVTAGMRGKGYTSFRGDELQEFEFEVLGVLRSWHPQGRVFLVELEHPVLEKSGVIAGMSGSPLYIDGRLLGAVAYGFRYSLTALAGVTPAEEMLVPFEALEAGEGERAEKEKSKALLRNSLARSSAWIAEDYMRDPDGSDALMLRLLQEFVAATLRPGGDFRSGIGVERLSGASSELGDFKPGSRLMPLPVPLSFSGIDVGRLGDLKTVLGSGGLVPVQAPRAGGFAPFDPDRDLRPGVPIGALLMTGDIDIASMGTLTFSDGKRVAAFGHPMVDAGKTDLPLVLGHVEAVVPSRLISFRLTSGREIIGSITQDRQSAIIGEIGRKAPMFPATVNISGFHDATYRYELAGHWRYAPMMSLYAAALSAQRWEGMSDRLTVDASVRIKLRGREEALVLENVYAGNPLRPSFELVMAPIQSLMLNPFEEVEIDSLDVDFKIGEELKAAKIESVRLEKQEVSPGEKLRMWVTLREYHGPARVEKITLDIPEDAEPGTTVRLYISDAAAVMASKYGKDPGLFRPQTLDGLIESLQVMASNTRLYVRGDFIRTGLRYAGEAMPALPGSAESMLKYGTVRGKTHPLMQDVKNSIDTGWVLDGSHGVEVRIN